MAPKKKRSDPQEVSRFIAEAQRERALRQQSYRERALNMFPHICARCGREFSGKTLRELTVHHKDHNHMNNPPDGSNWELLCLYCHDDEHQKMYAAGGSTIERRQDPPLEYRPFEGLGNLLKPGDTSAESG